MSQETGSQHDQDFFSENERTETGDSRKTRAGPKRKRSGGQPTDNSGSLFAIISEGIISHANVADNLIRSCNENEEQTTVQLIQFVIRSCGCQTRFTLEMLRMSNAIIIDKLIKKDEFDASGCYPLIAPGRKATKFRTDFAEFLIVLFRRLLGELALDTVLMTKLISFVEKLCESKLREFRHTGSFVAMKLMTALIEEYINFIRSEDNVRAEQLMSKLDDMFNKVFLQRYRDTAPEIRSVCVSEIGVWMFKLPHKFLNDEYLKFIAFSLSDRVVEVKKRCLETLRSFLSSERACAMLVKLTAACKDRILEMAGENNAGAIEAIRYISGLSRHREDILTDEEWQYIFSLVFSKNREIACATGQLLSERKFAYTRAAIAEENRIAKVRTIRHFVAFLINSGLPQYYPYAVDSFIDSNPMLKEWELMTNLLLAREPVDNPLSEVEETVLVDLLVCCVRQTATGQWPEGRRSDKKKLSIRESKKVKDEKIILTRHFIPLMSRLLNKYFGDSEKLVNLLVIFQHFDLSTYTSDRLVVHLKDLSKIIDNHSDKKIFDACAKIYEIFCGQNSPVKGRCDAEVEKIMADLVQNFLNFAYAHNSPLMNEQNNSDENEAFTLNLKKLASFCWNNDVADENFYSTMLLWVKKGNLPNDFLPEEMAKYPVIICYQSALRDYYKVKMAEDVAAQDRLSAKLKDFLEQCRLLIVHGKPESLKAEAYTIVCDMLIMFGNQFQKKQLGSLFLEVNSELQIALTDFVQKKVFDLTDDEDLASQRSYLNSFCRLVKHRIVEMKMITVVFKHYLQFYDQYGYLMKAAFEDARDMDAEYLGEILGLSLTELYAQLPNTSDTGSPAYREIQDLGKKFADLLGSNAVYSLHCEGIQFSVKPFPADPEDPSVPPPNLAFLKILCQLSGKLLAKDKKSILVQMKDHFPSVEAPILARWLPYQIYRRSLGAAAN